MDLCANCGKGEDSSNNLKACTACKLVKYCNRECQIAHRPQHKKECRRRAVELHDEKLFKQPPPREDCPICFLQLPNMGSGSTYYACCGKVICKGCVHSPVYDHQGNVVAEKKCPFCRTPMPKSNEEDIERRMKRIDMNDPIAIVKQGCYYRDGLNGLPRDYTKALELYHRAAELGHASAYVCIGYLFEFGKGVEVDKKKAKHYWELAAIGGDMNGRHNLGNNEIRAGNYDRALKHYIIAVKSGSSESLEQIKEGYSKGHVTKDDYMRALRAYQEYLGEIKSRQRDKAAEFRDKHYY